MYDNQNATTKFYVVWEGLGISSSRARTEVNCSWFYPSKVKSPRVVFPRAYDHPQDRIDHPDAKVAVSMAELAVVRGVNIKEEECCVTPTA